MTAGDGGPGRTLVGFDRLLHVLGAEAELLAASARNARLDGIVPGCPGLTLGETARHAGSLYRMVWRWLRDGERPGEWQRDPAPGQDLAGYVRSGIAPLLAELSAHAPDEPCPTWWPAQRDYGFWRRRMAHETTVHRYDVQGAAGGSVDDIPEDVALDGIDEVLTLWFVHRLGVLGVSATRDYVVTIRAGGLAWQVRARAGGNLTSRPGEPGFELETGYDEGTVVSGSPAQVYLWLWGRRPDQAVRVAGNLDAVAQLWALLRLATR